MSVPPQAGAMPTARDILNEYARLGLRPISGGDGTDDDDAAAKAAAEEKAAAEAKAKADAEETAKLGDAGKKALDAEREARASAERASKEATRELAALRKEKLDREQAAAKAAEEKAKADGEWERLASERETAITGVTTERDALKETLTRYDAILAPLVKERHDAIKAADAEVAKGFPADAPLLDQLAWLDDPRTKALLTKQSQHADNLRRWPTTPDTNGAGQPNEAAARASQARMYTEF